MYAYTGLEGSYTHLSLYIDVSYSFYDNGSFLIHYI